MRDFTCPACGGTRDIRLQGNVWLDVSQSGGVTRFLPTPGRPTWDAGCTMECGACGYVADADTFAPSIVPPIGLHTGDDDEEEDDDDDD